MKEYIEREAAIKAIENDCLELVDYTKEDAIQCVKAIPAADVVPVVRCQDCVYARPLKDMNYDYLCHYQAWRKAPAFRHGDTAALKEY